MQLKCFLSRCDKGFKRKHMQHLSYQVKLTGVTCTDNASGYSAVVSLLPIVGVHPSLLTPNAEVHEFFNNSTCINRRNMEIWKYALGVFKMSSGMTLLSPRVRLTTVSWREILAKWNTTVSLLGFSNVTTSSDNIQQPVSV